MTVSKINEISNMLKPLIMKPFFFNGIKIEINYADRAKHSKNWVVKTHHHPWFEFNYVAKGSVNTTIDGNEFLVKAGDSYIISPTVKHSHCATGEGDDGICIRFNIVDTINNPQNTEVINRIRKTRKHTFSSNIDKLKLSGGLYTAEAQFASWLFALFEKDNSELKTSVKAMSNISSQVDIYIEKYYNRKIKVQEIANAINISYRTLARKYKEETGFSVTEKIIMFRISNAKKMLLSTNLPIYTIAETCGFENEFYFSKCFSKQEHITPSAYRKAMKKV